MELKDTCTLALSKKTKKVKCFEFYCKELKRTLALHADLEHNNSSSVSDVITGFRLFELPIPIASIKMEQVERRLEAFIKHFTLEEIDKEFNRIEKEGNK